MAVLSPYSVVVYRPSESAMSNNCPPSLPTDFFAEEELANLPAVEQRESELRTRWVGSHLPKTDHASFSHVGTTNDDTIMQQRNLDLADQAVEILRGHKQQQRQSVDTALIHFQGASDVGCYKEFISSGASITTETAENLAFESTAPRPSLSKITDYSYGSGGRSSLFFQLRTVKGQVSIEIEADKPPYGTDFQRPGYQGIDLRVKSVAPGTDAQSIIAKLSGIPAGPDVRFTTDNPEFAEFCDTLTAGVKAEQRIAA